VSVCQRNAQVLAEVLIKPNPILCEKVLLSALQLQKPDVLVINKQRDQGNGRVGTADFETKQMRFFFTLGLSGKPFLRIIGPEAPFSCEKRPSGIHVAADNISTEGDQAWIIIRFRDHSARFVLPEGRDFEGKGLVRTALHLATKVFIVFLYPQFNRIAS
jgi:hypothetical protein